jgi:hypothetical protein
MPDRLKRKENDFEKPIGIDNDECLAIVWREGKCPKAAAAGQQPTCDQQSGLGFTSDGYSFEKKQLTAANLKLTDAEATKFWPVYDEHPAELVKINDEKFALIQEYADHLGRMTNEQASSFIRRWLDVDIAIVQLRQRYVPRVTQVLNGNKAATFFQLDRRLSMMIDLQLASQMPLVQAQE